MDFFKSLESQSYEKKKNCLLLWLSSDLDDNWYGGQSHSYLSVASNITLERGLKNDYFNAYFVESYFLASHHVMQSNYLVNFKWVLASL